MKHDGEIKQLAEMMFSGFHGVKLEEKSNCLLWWPSKRKQRQYNNSKYDTKIQHSVGSAENKFSLF